LNKKIKCSAKIISYFQLILLGTNMVGFIKKVRNSEFRIIFKEKLYPKYDPNPLMDSTRVLIANAMKRFKDCETKKNSFQIKTEIQAYKKFWKCYPYDYFLCNLYTKDNPVTRDELINYIPGFFWYYLFLPHHTSYNLKSIINNKIVTEQFFQSLSISQPKTLCKLINGIYYSPQMQRYTFNQVEHEITDNLYEKLFVKPAWGGGSKGIYIFNKNESELYTTRENMVFNENFLAEITKTRDYIVQPGVVQDPGISKIYPRSVNTFRLITENKEGVSRVVCGVLRIGRGLNEVDNASAGGIFLKIDINCGIVGDEAMSYEYEKFVEHPDTHFIFHNYKIPRWDEIRKFATESADKLPFFIHLGWDIALTVNGPIAIEANLNPSIELLQIPYGGLREQFGIESPDYYWKNPGKRG
jgi:hypothetical protein